MGERMGALTSYICISSNVPLGIFDLGRYDLVHMSYFSGPASCNWSWERTGITWNWYMFSRRHNMRDFITGRIMKDHWRLTYIWLLSYIYTYIFIKQIVYKLTTLSVYHYRNCLVFINCWMNIYILSMKTVTQSSVVIVWCLKQKIVLYVTLYKYDWVSLIKESLKY
jgi:hypothetical protein